MPLWPLLGLTLGAFLPRPAVFVGLGVGGFKGFTWIEGSELEANGRKTVLTRKVLLCPVPYRLKTTLETLLPGISCKPFLSEPKQQADSDS